MLPCKCTLTDLQTTSAMLSFALISERNSRAFFSNGRGIFKGSNKIQPKKKEGEISPKGKGKFEENIVYFLGYKQLI